MPGRVKRAVQLGKRRIRQVAGLEPIIGIQLDCPKAYYGSIDYGAWCICPVNLDDRSIVYSFGVGEEISFDLSIIEQFKLQVHAFDPTPRSIGWVKNQQLPAEFKFFEYGLAHFDGTAYFNPPDNPNHVSHTILERPNKEGERVKVAVYRLESILNKLGHDHIDLLKMDIEGAEYLVIEDLIRSDVHINQLLVEFHHRFDDIDVSQTKLAVSALNDFGFKLFNISPLGSEFSFIRV